VFACAIVAKGVRATYVPEHLAILFLFEANATDALASLTIQNVSCLDGRGCGVF